MTMITTERDREKKTAYFDYLDKECMAAESARREPFRAPKRTYFNLIFCPLRK